MKRVSQKMIIINYYRSISKLILIAFLAITTFSCSNDDDQPPHTDGISQEIKDLIYFRGDEKAETVMILIPGGPSTEFATDFVDDFASDSNQEGIITVTVHQAQTLNPDIVVGNDITLTQANSFNTESIEMLSEVITYFKDEGRTVYVLGYSFGAFVTQDLIAKKGINSADKYLIISGRLDMNDIIWQAAAEGKKGYFENGVTPVVEPEPDVKERNFNRISAGFAMNKYTQLFNTIEDLSNITYIYGENDEAVGRLTTDEVQFLQSKNTNIISGPGNHTTTFEAFIFQGLEEAFGIVLQ
ncbi:hypothetical protein [Psychroserpens algicola]|uniref:Alpha/beta hydrolase n=1 Tax=Psychroserpens algicola TaxID=1719034 RepID=A0ABT0HAU9_9FLAO|nr:hypothetical protein [Psychroserpens algicola]MCK8481506.1 hypothetical protein [Psychroserpens algicola]